MTESKVKVQICQYAVEVFDGYLGAPVILCRLTTGEDGTTEDMWGCDGNCAYKEPTHA